MEKIKNLSISNKISLTVFGIIGITLSIYLVVFFLNNDSMVHERIEEENQQISSLLTESIKLSMAAGADDTTPLIKNLSKFEIIKDVRIIPSEIIQGEHSQNLDEFEREVIKNGETKNYYENYKDSEVLRSISALKADATCLDCHEARQGDILAIVSIRQSLDKAYANMASQKIHALWTGFLAAILTFALVAYFVKRNLLSIYSLLIL